METVSGLVVPFMLVLARVSGMLAVVPIFGWRGAPVLVRVGIVLLVSIVLACVVPAAAPAGGDWLVAALALVREAVTGLALGLAVALVFECVRQGGLVMRQQMGLSVASEIDPLTGEESQPVSMLLEMAFTLLFLGAGGHQLILLLLARSYDAFPMGTAPTAAAMAQSVLSAGALMLTFGLHLAAPMIAAFLLLAVVLAILARILPEMNILLLSLPLRIGLGLLMAAAILPSLVSFTARIGDWISGLLAA